MLAVRQRAVELDPEVCRRTLKLESVVDLDVELVACLPVEVECGGHGIGHGEL